MYQVIYDKLIEVARAHTETNYETIGSLVSSKDHDFDLYRELDEIDRFEDQNKRPMITAVVINPISGTSGKGFLACAFRLGKFTWGEDEDSFWSDELRRVWEYWASH